MEFYKAEILRLKNYCLNEIEKITNDAPVEEERFAIQAYNNIISNIDKIVNREKKKKCNLEGVCWVGNPVNNDFHCKNAYDCGKTLKGVACQYYY